MNKIFNINLGGYPFTIDEDAYAQLTKYIDTIERHFASSEGVEDIISDIEIRMAELFNQELNNKPILSTRELDNVIKIMGRPEDFGAEPHEEHAHSSTQKEYAHQTIVTGKRLFRDPEDKVVGGVCSGIAAYFGVNDPLWIRLGMAFVIFSGIGFPLYFILWAIVPSAKTSSDRLSMRGEEANVENIGRMIGEELDHMKDSFDKFENEFRSKNQSKKKRISASSVVLTPFRWIISIIRTIFSGIITVFKKILRPIFKLVLVFFVLLLIITWFSSLVAGAAFTPFVDFFFEGQRSIGYLGIFNGLSIVTISLLGFVLLLAKYFRGYRVKPGVRVALGIFWLANVFSFTNCGISTAKQWRYSAEHIETQTLDKMETDLVELEVERIPRNKFLVQFGDIYMDDKTMKIDDVQLRIKNSDNEKIYIKKRITSFGKNSKEAMDIASSIAVPLEIKDGKIVINPEISLQKGDKYRGQEVDIDLYVPLGTNLKMNNEVRRVISYSSFDDYGRHNWGYNYAEHEWKMGENGLEEI